jgi:hypothetical protein
VVVIFIGEYFQRKIITNTLGEDLYIYTSLESPSMCQKLYGYVECMTKIVRLRAGI